MGTFVALNYTMWDIKNFIFVYENKDIGNIIENEKEITEKGYDYLSLKSSLYKFKKLYMGDNNSVLEIKGGIIFNGLAKDIYEFIKDRNIDKMV